MTAEGEVCFSHAQVARNSQWWGIASPEKATLNLRSAKVGSLLNDEKAGRTRGAYFLTDLFITGSTIEFPEM
jgi:hypothetical protein